MTSDIVHNLQKEKLNQYDSIQFGNALVLIAWLTSIILSAAMAVKSAIFHHACKVTCCHHLCDQFLCYDFKETKMIKTCLN